MNWRKKARERGEIPLRIALASVRATTHIFRVLANRGLVAPQDIADSTAGVISILEELPEELHASLRENVVQNYDDIKQIAAANWKGE